MHRDKIEAICDQQADHDTRWVNAAATKSCLLFLLDSVFAPLPPDARVLCVGLGAGAELAHLAKKNPGWQFTVVEPSVETIDMCRLWAQNEGFAPRCQFYEGYLDTLAEGAPHDAATCFFVSQFILDLDKRAEFFAGIARRLKPGGLLASSDLASDVDSAEFELLLCAWLALFAETDISQEQIRRMRNAYASDVAVLAPARTAAMIAASGFATPVQFFQARLIHAWLSKRL